MSWRWAFHGQRSPPEPITALYVKLMNSIISHITKRLPGWATSVAALMTLILLFRMQRFYATQDLLLFATAFAIELTLLELLTRTVRRIRYTAIRILALLIPAILGCTYVAQLYSVWISGGFIPPIALANTEVVGLIAFNGFYWMIGAFLIALFAHAWVTRNTVLPEIGRPQIFGTALLILAYVAIIQDQPTPRGIRVAHGETPVSSFAHSLATYAGMSGQNQISAAELNTVRSAFARRSAYQVGFPEAFTASLPATPNIIVIFTEGMSARWMETYGGVRPGLTPNLDRLAGGSMVFRNYYNHTAATFRGLRGQLTSGHQEIDGYNDEGTGFGQRDASKDVTAVSRVSLPEVLRGQGYHSLFFLSQQDYINKMLGTLGFDEVLGRDYLYEKYLAQGQNHAATPKYLSDAELFDTMLSELEALPDDEPFFAAAYNFQTHAFFDSDKKYGDGENIVLNRFHTYDRDIGRFVDRFMGSRLHENTLLVFTSDHSTFPDPVAVVADNRIKGYFVDTIPLLLYWKGVEHREIDVGGKNSLDLAPSILSLVGARKTPNLFLGCTFFETCPLDRVSNVADEYILTDSNGSYSEAEVPEDQKQYFDTTKAAIHRFKSMDMVIDQQ